MPAEGTDLWWNEEIMQPVQSSIHHQAWIMEINAHPDFVPGTLIISWWGLSCRKVLAVIQFLGVKVCDVNPVRHLVLGGLGISSSPLSVGRQWEAMALGMSLWVEENLPRLIWLPFLFPYCTLYRTLAVAVFHLTKGKASRLSVLCAPRCPHMATVCSQVPWCLLTVLPPVVVLRQVWVPFCMEPSLLSQLRRHLPLLFHFFVAHVISTSHPKYPVRLGAMSDSNLVSPHPHHTALQVVSSLPIFVEWIKEITRDW